MNSVTASSRTMVPSVGHLGLARRGLLLEPGDLVLQLGHVRLGRRQVGRRGVGPGPGGCEVGAGRVGGSSHAQHERQRQGGCGRDA